jgi:hypothetical protein
LPSNYITFLNINQDVLCCRLLKVESRPVGPSETWPSTTAGRIHNNGEVSCRRKDPVAIAVPHLAQPASTFRQPAHGHPCRALPFLFPVSQNGGAASFFLPSGSTGAARMTGASRPMMRADGPGRPRIPGAASCRKTGAYDCSDVDSEVFIGSSRNQEFLPMRPMGLELRFNL